MEINGIAHVYISVINFEACSAFYRQLLPFMGLTRIVHDDSDTFYCIGGRTGFGLTRYAAGHRGTAFAQDRAGLRLAFPLDPAATGGAAVNEAVITAGNAVYTAKRQDAG